MNNSQMYYRNINNVIMEDHPYILPFNIMEYEDDGTFKIDLLKDQVYFNRNFGELLQVLTTAGSYCIALKTGRDTKQALLGSRLSIKKHNLRLCEKDIACTVTPILYDTKAAKCIINVLSGDQLIYSFDLAYTIMPERVFKKLFKKHHDSSDRLTNKEEIPKVNNKYLTDNTFVIDMEPFNINHCLGHFADYPIIPSVRIFDCLVVGANSWIKEAKPEATGVLIDSVEIFQNSALAITNTYQANVTAKEVCNNLLMFSCSLVDKCGNEYGYYILRIKYD